MILPPELWCHIQEYLDDDARVCLLLAIPELLGFIRLKNTYTATELEWVENIINREWSTNFHPFQQSQLIGSEYLEIMENQHFLDTICHIHGSFFTNWDFKNFFHDLKRLSAYDSIPDDLPTDWGRLISLTTLGLSDNSLSHLPDSLQQLTNLKSIILTQNLFTEIPPILRFLPKLRSIMLNANDLKDLNLDGFDHLEELDLRGNRITQIPDDFGNLKYLIFTFYPLGFDEFVLKNGCIKFTTFCDPE